MSKKDPCIDMDEDLLTKVLEEENRSPTPTGNEQRQVSADRGHVRSGNLSHTRDLTSLFHSQFDVDEEEEDNGKAYCIQVQA